MARHTVDSWRASTEKVEKWKEVLAQPIVGEALDALTRQFLHSRVMVNDLNAHALMGAKRDGYYECLENIWAMARPAEQASKKALPDPWQGSASTKSEVK